MDVSSMASAASDVSNAKTAYNASIKTMKMALDAQEQTGQSVLALLNGGSVNNAQAGAQKGSLIDVIA